MRARANMDMDDDAEMRAFKQAWSPAEIEVLERWAAKFGNRDPSLREIAQLRREVLAARGGAKKKRPPPPPPPRKNGAEAENGPNTDTFKEAERSRSAYKPQQRRLLKPLAP